MSFFIEQRQKERRKKKEERGKSNTSSETRKSQGHSGVGGDEGQQFQRTEEQFVKFAWLLERYIILLISRQPHLRLSILVLADDVRIDVQRFRIRHRRSRAATFYFDKPDKLMQLIQTIMEKLETAGLITIIPESEGGIPIFQLTEEGKTRANLLTSQMQSPSL